MMLKQGLALLVLLASAVACQGGNPSNNTETTSQDGNVGGDGRTSQDGSEGGAPGRPDGSVDLARLSDAQVARDALEPSADASSPAGDGEPAEVGPEVDAQFSPDGSAEMPCVNGSTLDCGDECPGGTSACVGGAWAACIGPAETCNGVDDDCDGVVDEDFLNLGDACMVGVGACARAGHFMCNPAGDDVVCDAEAGHSGPETCNGLDDDCDGQVDEDFHVGDACEAGVGECRAAGVIACAPDGTASCTGQPAFPGAERCNGLDDNCDGQVDEGFDLGAACSVGTGLCEARGVRVCGPQGNAVCGARAGEPLPEQCNGLDDNCDGQVDEAFPTLGSRCSVGTGACERSGEILCNDAGDGVRCDAVAGSPSPEQCNELDDDCDGQVDDGFDVGAACSAGVGACERSGVVTCLPNGHAACSAAPGQPTAETCNGLDDDCDGLVDDGDDGAAIQEPCYDGPAGTLNVGVCQAGTKVCVGGAFGACEHEVVPSAEVCDQLDNDCNGIADNGIAELGNACGTGQLGRCATGHVACSPLGAVCAPDFAPSPETCNDIDDDCDGSIDGGTGKGDPCTSGLGECVRSGTLVCAPDGQTACNAVPGAPQATDICDGRDNNCDGVVDDGCPLSIGPGPLIEENTFGGERTGRSPFSSLCPGGQAARGFYVVPDTVFNLNGIRALCGAFSLDQTANVVPFSYEVVISVGGESPQIGRETDRQGHPGVNLVCPANQLVTGFSGTAGSDGIIRIRFACSSIAALTAAQNYQPRTTPSGSTDAAGPNVGGSPFAFDCGASKVAVGIHGTVDAIAVPAAIGLDCAPLQVMER